MTENLHSFLQIYIFLPQIIDSKMNFKDLHFILLFMTIFIAALSSPIENPNNDLMKRQDQASCSQLAASVVGDTYYLNCTLASGSIIYISGPKSLACTVCQ
ncbi:hypothetical protein F8M41_009259 [Gigaspora margarita]|uniref:Uncharacterized protein n=2 Tax=Gigaspora margarita TaxID=4874 RepID=A0A8H4B5E3_GIGMA|nr:hypothetical protein F8M41_009259 [Gigaspora margarita]